MFIIIATAPLNDGTRGFRYNFFGKKGLVRLRKHKSRGFKMFEKHSCTTAHHFWKLSVYIENSRTVRPLDHFAG